jgi:hypothetical protein
MRTEFDVANRPTVDDCQIVRGDPSQRSQHRQMRGSKDVQALDFRDRRSANANRHGLTQDLATQLDALAFRDRFRVANSEYG